MQKQSIFSVLVALALATLACGININLPISTDIKTGPTTIKEIRVPEPADGESNEIILAFGAGELTLSSGAEQAILEGTATFNVEDLRPEVVTQGNQTKISNGNLEINGIPNFQEKVINRWDFILANDIPIDLTIKSGAYVGDLELGGLSLSSLQVADGAADVDLNFAEPNQITMGTLRYETGASNISLTNLANARFETMIFQGGAGNYELDFSGDLRQDAEIFIEAGLSSMTITVPDGTNVELSIEGGLTNIAMRGAWQTSGNRYTLQGDGPQLNITVEMGAGNLVLQNR